MRIGTLVAAVAFVGLPAAATTVLERAGPWEAYVTVGRQGTPMCGISQFAGPYGLMLKYHTGEAFLHLSKNSWAVPRSARMRVAFAVDGRPVWTGTFTGTSDPRMIEGGFASGEEAIAFVRAFAWGQWMTIRFLDGTEAPWGADLTGTLRVSRAFLACVLALEERRRPTQPHGRTPPAETQPLGRPREPQPSGRGM